MAETSPRVGRTGPASLCAAGVESCSSTPTCPSQGVAVLFLAELVSWGKRRPLTSRGPETSPDQNPALPRMWPPGWLPGSSRGEEYLVSLPSLVQGRSSLRSSCLGWIPGQAEWNRCGPCTRGLPSKRASSPAPSQPRPEPEMPKASDAPDSTSEFGL